MSDKPNCDICGQPYFRHLEVTGVGRVCPISGTTYREPKPVNPQLPQIVSDGQKAADVMRQAAVDLPDRFPEIKGMLEASARVIEGLCDELAKVLKP